MAIATYEREAREAMKTLCTYKAEFEPSIKMYAQLQEQFRIINKEFKLSGYKYEVETTQGTKKAPIVTTLESLRKDILTYANSLGLTPHGLLKIKDNAFVAQKESKLANIFNGLDR